MKGMSKSMSCPNIAAPGEGFSTIWHVEQIAHATLSINVSMSAGSTDSAMSILEERIIVQRTWWMRSQMAFACGLLNVVGLRFMLYEPNYVSKCLYIKYWHLGYPHWQSLWTYWLMWSDDLSKISSLIIFSFLLTTLVCSFISNGSSTILNQLEAGSIMVRTIKSIAEPSLPLSVYGLTKSMHSASHGLLVTILDGKSPYLRVPLMFTWQVLHGFVIY